MNGSRIAFALLDSSTCFAAVIRSPRGFRLFIKRDDWSRSWPVPFQPIGLVDSGTFRIVVGESGETITGKARDPDTWGQAKTGAPSQIHALAPGPDGEWLAVGPAGATWRLAYYRDRWLRSLQAGKGDLFAIASAEERTLCGGVEGLFLRRGARWSPLPLKLKGAVRCIDVVKGDAWAGTDAGELIRVPAGGNGAVVASAESPIISIAAYSGRVFATDGERLLCLQRGKLAAVKLPAAKAPLGPLIRGERLDAGTLSLQGKAPFRPSLWLADEKGVLATANGKTFRRLPLELG